MNHALSRGRCLPIIPQTTKRNTKNATTFAVWGTAAPTGTHIREISSRKPQHNAVLTCGEDDSDSIDAFECF
eukprot:COSAG01_NODE_2400_length_7761_cov_120.247194_12_plen_72_part_00